MRVPKRLEPFFSPHFLKFCSVGASGVVVNLGCLKLLLELGLLSSVASALAIQVSIVSNFAVNELWTFRAERQGAVLARAARFQAVSLVGAALQWAVFIAGNIGLAWLLGMDLGAYFGGDASALTRYLHRPIQSPPDVGAWLYLSQLAGIGVATAWNFLANFHWTWKQRP